jgi:hypothetical protein
MKKVELPDFDDMIALATKIGKSKIELTISKNTLDVVLASITKKVTSDPIYWMSGKPPSNAHIQDSYHVLGTSDEERTQIFKLKDTIANLDGNLKTDEMIFDVYRELINVWRTQSANERSAFLEG